jgi:limonene-1,2-epoxide hydrolase
MSATPLAIASEFFAHWSANRIDDALAMLSDDVLYDNVPFPDIVGQHGVGTAFTVDWKVIRIAADGNVVLNERIDVFTHTGGGTITLPVMGTVTVVDGQITVWRDYFDPADFDRQLGAITR